MHDAQADLERIRNVIDEVMFPASREQIVDTVGDEVVRVEDRTMTLASLMRGLKQDSFRNRDDFLDALKDKEKALDH